MEQLKFEIELQSPDAQTEILEFSEFIKGEIPGLRTQIKENPESGEGAMSVELLPVLQMILTSTAVAAGVKGIFSVIKDYFDLKKQNNALEADKSKVIITFETEPGKTETISMHLFNDEEKEKLIKMLLSGNTNEIRERNENPANDKEVFKKEIKIFLASSSQLKEERDSFRIFLGDENDRLIKKGIYLRKIIWEDFLDAMSQTRLQDEYNKAIKDCDVFVMLYFTKVGAYTAEEFRKAFKQFKETNKPRIYTYFKNANVRMGDIEESDYLSLKEFQKNLKELGHFQSEFTNDTDLHMHFKRQLETLYDL